MRASGRTICCVRTPSLPSKRTPRSTVTCRWIPAIPRCRLLTMDCSIGGSRSTTTFPEPAEPTPGGSSSSSSERWPMESTDWSAAHTRGADTATCSVCGATACTTTGGSSALSGAISPISNGSTASGGRMPEEDRTRRLTSRLRQPRISGSSIRIGSTPSGTLTIIR